MPNATLSGMSAKKGDVLTFSVDGTDDGTADNTVTERKPWNEEEGKLEVTSEKRLIVTLQGALTSTIKIKTDRKTGERESVTKWKFATNVDGDTLAKLHRAALVLNFRPAQGRVV